MLAAISCLGQIPGKLGAETVAGFQSPHDMRSSTYGHLVVVDALETELIRLGGLTGGTTTIACPL
jgi:hypothetical protein